MNNQKWLVICTLLFLLPAAAFSQYNPPQFGPMGIGNTDGSPTPLGNPQPRLLLWLDGSSASPYTNQAPVDIWYDKSGNHHNFMRNPTHATYKPSLRTSGSFSGPHGSFPGAPETPCVKFLDQDDQLECANFELPGDGYTIYFVIKTDDDNFGLFSYTDLATNEPEVLIHNDNGILQQMNSVDHTSAIGDLSDDTWNYGGIAWSSANDDNWEYTKDLTDEGGYNNFNGITFSDNGTAMIGDIQNTANTYGTASSNPFEGSIAEIFIYEGHLSRAATRLLRTYLWVKYGLNGAPGNWDKFHGNMDVSAGIPWGGKYYAPIGIGNDAVNPNAGSVDEARSAGLVLRVNHNEWTQTTSYLCAAPVGNSIAGLASNTTTTSNLTGTSPAVVNRWTRLWEIAGNSEGNTQEYQIAFDFGEGIGGTTPQNKNNFVLLYRNSPTSGNFTVLPVPDANKSVIDDELVFKVPKSDLITPNRYYTIGTIDNGASSLTGSIHRTWYGYQSGDWSNPQTWTLDGSAAPSYLNPDGQIPAVQDNVYIGAGRVVTLDTTLPLLGDLTVFGTLDLASEARPVFETISGSGLIKCATNNFPAGNSTAFADPLNGGTLEFYGNGNFTQTISLTVNKLKINLASTSAKLTLAANLTTNGLFEVDKGKFIVNNATNASRTITSYGSVIVESSGQILVSDDPGQTLHKWYFYNDFINNDGVVKFTNRTAATYNNYTHDENYDVIDAYFSSDSQNQKLVAKGVSNFSRIVVNKGVDMTYILSISSDNPNDFKLLGRCDFSMVPPNNYWEEGFNKNSLELVNGTAEIKENIFIPILQGNIYSINHTAQLWINGGTVTKDELGAPSEVAGSGLVIYGKIKVSDGELNSHNQAGILVRDAGVLQVDGGTVNANTFQTSNLGAASYANLGGLIMNGGTMNLNGTWSGGIRTINHTLCFTYPGNLFLMTGGTINVTGPSNAGLVFVNSDPENASVSGGTINLDVSTTSSSRPYKIASRVAFWNLNLTRSSTSNSVRRFWVTGGGAGPSQAPATLPVLDLIVRNNFSISGANTPTIEMGNGGDPADLYVYGNLDMGDGSVYIHDNNTTHFVGSSNSFLTFGGSATFPFYNVEVNKDDDSKYVQIQNSGPGVAMDIQGSLDLERGYFNNKNKFVELKGNITNRTEFGVDGNYGYLRMNGSSGRQEIISDGGVFHKLVIDNPDGVALKNDGITVKTWLKLEAGSFFIGDYKLRMESLQPNVIYGGNNTDRFVVCSGNASAGGVEIMNQTGAPDMSYPIGVNTGSGIKYTPAEIHINTSSGGNPNPPPVIATGGDETTIEENGSYYKVHTFTQDGTLTVNQSVNAEYLIVGGGGGGGAATSRNAGGGGGGGVVGGTKLVSANTYTITVGDGGTGGTGSGASRKGTNGNSSTLFGLTALGGGAGAGATTSPPSWDGNDGGSGGGGSIQNGGSPGSALQPGTNPSATIDAGYNGGTRSGYGSGGGGAGGNTNNGFGGPGLQSSITGLPVLYGGGGAGNSAPTGVAPVGSTVVNDDGVDGTGAGGGAGTGNQGRTGGSGIVVVRYQISEADYNAINGIGEATGGYIRITPVDTLLSTVDLSGDPDYLSFYWKVSSTGFDTQPNVSQVFQYDQSDVRGTETNFESGRVLSEMPFTRSYDNGPATAHVNTSSNKIYFNGSDKAMDNTGDGTPLVDANYTAGAANRFPIGTTPEVYFSKSTVVGAPWNNASSWNTCNGCTNPSVYHSSSRPNASDYPKEGDIAVIGYNPSNGKPHVYNSPAGGIQAAQILFTPLQGTPGHERYNGSGPGDLGILRPTLKIFKTSDINKVAQISGEGELWLEQNYQLTPGTDIDLGVTDIGGFLAQDSSVVVIHNANDNPTPTNFLPSILPNLFIADGSPQIGSDIHIRGNLEVAGNSKLYLSKTRRGNLEIDGDLILAKYQSNSSPPQVLFNKDGTQKTIDVHGDVKLLGSTAHIGIYSSGSPPPPGSPWTPAEVGALLWLDANDPATITLQGQNVKTWKNKAPLGTPSGSYDASQLTSGKQPTLNTTGLNGQPAINFDGTDDFLAIPHDPVFNMGANQDFEIFSVTQIDNPNEPYATSAMIYAKGVSNPTDIMLYVASNRYRLFMSHGDIGMIASINQGTGASMGWARRQGNNAYLYNTTGGYASESGIANVSQSGNTHKVTIGAAEDGTARFLDGNIAEIIVVKHALTNDERQQMEGYLAHKWGIALPEGHPYKDEAPIIGGVGNKQAQLIVDGDIIQNVSSTSSFNNGLELYKTGTDTAFVNLVVTNKGKNAFINSHGPTPRLWKLTVDKGTDIGSGFTFNTNVQIKGPADEYEKPVNIENGLLKFNNPNIDVTLSSGGADFVIPPTGGLELDQGHLGISGDETGIELSGLLKMRGGSLSIGDTEGENNYIEYGGGGEPKLYVEDGTLTVGSQIRRNLSTPQGALDYRQTGGDVVIGKYGAPATTRGMLEVMNPGSRFEFTDGTLTFVRGVSRGSTPSILLSPTTYNVFPASDDIGGPPPKPEIIIGNTDSPDDATIKNFGILSTIPLHALTINSTNSPVVHLITNDLELNGDLTIHSDATLNCYGHDLLLHKDVTNDGTLNSLSETVRFIHPDTATVSGSGDYNLYNLERTGGSDGLTIVQTDLLVNNDLSNDAGEMDFEGNKITVKGDVTTDGTFSFDTGSEGLIFSGTVLQKLKRTTTNYGISKIDIMTINNESGLSIPAGYAHFIIGKNLRLEKGIFNLTGNQLEMGLGSKFTPVNSFKETNMIVTGGTYSNYGVRVNVPANSHDDIFVPLGLDRYMPVNLDFSQPASPPNPAYSSGTTASSYLLRLNQGENGVVINDTEDPPGPQITDLQNVLGIYYSVDGTDIGDGFKMDLKFHYNQQYVQVTSPYSEADYIAAWVLADSTTISKYGTGSVDEVNNIITVHQEGDFDGNQTGAVDGDYFAGIDDAIPNTIITYETNKSSGNVDEGDDGDGNPNEYDIPVPGGGAPRGALVIVKSGHTLNFNIDGVNFYRTIIESGAMVRIARTSQHRLGKVSGEGTIFLDGYGNLPAGDYNDFLGCDGGKLIYQALGTDNFEVLSNMPPVKEVSFYSFGGNITIANNAVNICDNLNEYGTVKAANSALLTVGGDLNVTGNFDLRQGNTLVKGDINTSGSGSILAGNTGKLTVWGDVNLDGNAFDLGTIFRETHIEGDLTKTSGTINEGTGGAKLIFDGILPQTITGDFTGTSKIPTLELDNGTGLTLAGSNVDVSDALKLTDGNIFTATGNMLKLTADGTHVEPVGGQPNSFVDGPMQWALGSGDAERKFPIGRVDRYQPLFRYRPLSISSRSAARTWEVEYTDTIARIVPSIVSMIPDPFNSPAIETVSLQEFWRVKTDGGSTHANIRLSWGDSSVVSTNTSDQSKLVVLGYNDNTDVWDSYGGEDFNYNSATNRGDVKSIQQVSFSERYLTLGSSDGINPLPVTWLYFNGENNGADNILSWATASEQNNDYFELERSLDAHNWTSIAHITGAGYSTTKRTYNYTDKDAPFGRVYYRLSQVDFDGKRDFAPNVVSLEKSFSKEKEVFDFLLYPNPSQIGTVRFRMSNISDVKANVSIYDLSGKLLSQNYVQIDGQGTSAPVVCNFNPGIYLVTVIVNDKIRSKPLVITK